MKFLVLNALSSPHALTTQTPPRNPMRVGWSLEWCDCGLPPSDLRGDFHHRSSDAVNTNSSLDADVRGGGGVQASDPAANGTLLIVWPDGGDPGEGVNITYNNGVPTWVTWSRPMRSVQWRCTAAHTVGTTSLPTPSRVWSVQVLSRPKHEIGCGGKLSGRLRFVGWDTDSNSTKTTTSSVVYSSERWILLHQDPRSTQNDRELCLQAHTRTIDRSVPPFQLAFIRPFPHPATRLVIYSITHCLSNL